MGEQALSEVDRHVSALGQPMQNKWADFRAYLEGRPEDKVQQVTGVVLAALGFLTKHRDGATHSHDTNQ